MSTRIVNPGDGVVEVILEGVLDDRSIPVVRRVLDQCMILGSRTVVVNIRHLQVAERHHLAVFPAAARSGEVARPLILLAAPAPEVRAMISGDRIGDVPVFDTLALATAAASRAGARRLELSMPPLTSAPATARDLVGHACARWGVQSIRDSACLVVSELVSNAVLHARTDLRLTVGMRGDYLTIAVDDGSQRPPAFASREGAQRDRAHGLVLVDRLAVAVGSIPTAQGKRVWATLRARAPGSTTHG